MSMMEDMGFGERWRMWSFSCVSTVTLAVLGNGSPTDFFSIDKGLRHGDPLSSLLFNLCVEGLFALWNRLAIGEEACGFRIGPGLCLNHLQFADDTLVFCEAKGEKVEELFDVLVGFLWGSGLKLNYTKSVLVGCGVEEGVVRRLATNLGIEVASLPLPYLGTMLGVTR